jgi:hypothetical protein
MSDMTRAEREDLQRLIRQRERLLKSAAKERSAELLADFENQMGQEYSFNQDEVWKKAREPADREVKKAQTQIAARCVELGIPKRFAPDLTLGWWGRGENALKERRSELRKMAQTQMGSLEAQTELACAGLTSEAAKSFVDKLPAIADLMPMLSFAEVAGEAAPPVAEQLVSSNALRQRRHREKIAALRNGQQALHNGENTSGDCEAP